MSCVPTSQASQLQLNTEQSPPATVQPYMKRSFAVIGCLTLFCSCGPKSPEPSTLDSRLAEVKKQIQQRQARVEFVDDNTAFALDLYQQLRPEKGE